MPSYSTTTLYSFFTDKFHRGSPPQDRIVASQSYRTRTRRIKQNVNVLFINPANPEDCRHLLRKQDRRQSRFSADCFTGELFFNFTGSQAGSYRIYIVRPAQSRISQRILRDPVDFASSTKSYGARCRISTRVTAK